MKAKNVKSTSQADSKKESPVSTSKQVLGAGTVRLKDDNRK